MLRRRKFLTVEFKSEPFIQVGNSLYSRFDSTHFVEETIFSLRSPFKCLKTSEISFSIPIVLRTNFLICNNNLLYNNVFTSSNIILYFVIISRLRLVKFSSTFFSNLFIGFKLIFIIICGPK
jgi:hypothetical protein